MSRLYFYLQVWIALFKNSLVRALEFKTNFVARGFVEVCWVSMQIVFFTAVFGQVGSLANWNYWEIIFFCGSMFIVDGLYMMLLFDNMNSFGRLMQNGMFDFYLLRPVHSLFLGGFRNVNVVSLLNLCAGVVVCAYPVYKGYIHIEAQQWLIWGAYLLLGTLMVIMLGIFLISFGFWTIQTQPIQWLFFELYRLAFRPDDLYSGWLRRVLLSAFPAGFFVSIPVRLALGKVSGPYWYLLPFLITAVITTLAVSNWQRGVKRYEGAMS